MKLEKDTMISHYKILSAIGKDDVNLAQDECVRSLTVKEGFRGRNGPSDVRNGAVKKVYRS